MNEQDANLLLDSWRNWITGCVSNRTGQITDAYSHRPLLFQYHYPAFMLGASCVLPRSFPDEAERNVWRFFSNIPASQYSVSVEFNAFMLTLAHCRCAQFERPFQRELQCYIEGLEWSSLETLRKKNRNFSLMLHFVFSYMRRHGFSNVPDELYEYTRTILSDTLSSEGFLVDTPIGSRKGYISMVYHVKMAFCLLCDGLINQNPHSLDVGKRAIDVVISLGDPDELLAYGRSQNSLFGYANLYGAVKILSSLYAARIYDDWADQIIQKIRAMQGSSGEVALNPAGDNRGRPGFDYYMHTIVYNTYAWAIISWADYLATSPAQLPRDIGVYKPPEDSYQNCKYYRDSGFLSFSSNGFKLLLNTRRHYPAKLSGDPRYPALSPIMIKNEGGIIVPPVPIYYGRFIHFARHNSFWERLRVLPGYATYVLQQWPYRNFLDNSGFLPFLVVDGKTKVCAGTQKSLKVESEEGGSIIVIRSRFVLNAVRSKYSIRKFLRLNSTERFSSSENELSVTMRLTDRRIVYEFEITVDAMAWPKTKLTHFNLRAAATSLFSLSADKKNLVCDGKMRITHSRSLFPLTSEVVPGAVKEVQYLRAAINIEGKYVGRFKTEIEF